MVPRHPFKRHFSLGFTLIELMVVVVIIAILSAIVIPRFLSYREESIPDAPAKKAMPGSQPAAPVKSIKAAVPVTDSADVAVGLKARHYLHRLNVYTLFDAVFKGEFDFRNTSDRLDRIKVVFPFPEGTSQAGNVSLTLQSADGTFTEPDNVYYTLKGITWYGSLQKGKTVKAKVTYSAQGRDKFIYEGPGAGRAGLFKLRLSLEGVTSELVPADALQPSSVSPSEINWNYKNLVTDRPVVLELPGAMSPVGRLALMLKLAGLAVFLFGLGFLYLSDYCQPGRLDNFHWGDFLLLALNYFLFFIIFMILSRSGDMHFIAAMLLAAVLSIPLLMIHVSRILDWRFATHYTLPLTLLTLVFVINGVYGGAVRHYIFILMMVAVIAFFTFTYKTWSEKRSEHRKIKEAKEKERQEARSKERAEQERLAEEAETLKAIQKKIDDRFVKFKQRWEKASTVAVEAELLLKRQDSAECDSQRQDLTEKLASLEAYRALIKQSEEALIKMAATEDLGHQEKRAEAFEHELTLNQMRLDQDIQQVSSAMGVLKKHRKQVKVRSVQKAEMPHCMACGKASPQSTYCPFCGVERPKDLHCRACGHITPLPVHIIRSRKRLAEFHCPVCGELHEPLE